MTAGFGGPRLSGAGSNTLDKMEQIFEIHATDVDTREVLERIEARVAQRGDDPAEVEWVRQLSFTPVPPAREYGFDPAGVTELFERPVAAPDFNSPKFARFRGPLKWVARVLFRFFSNLHDKLNQNKIHAFYNVVHELIAVNYRHERLLERFEHLQRENYALRDRAGAADLNPNNDSINSMNANDTLDTLPLAPVAATLESLNREVVATLRGLVPGAGVDHPVVLLDDHGGGLARELTHAGLRQLRINCVDAREYLQLHHNLPGVVRAEPDVLLAGQDDASLAAVLIPDLGRFSVEPNALPELVLRKLIPGGVAYFRLQRGLVGAPFAPVLRCDADQAALRRLCESIGFRIIQESRPEGLREGSFDLLAQKIG